VLEGRHFSQADAAKVLAVTQPKISALRHYKLAGFSVERLMNLLTALDDDHFAPLIVVSTMKSSRCGAGQVTGTRRRCLDSGSAMPAMAL
jgi:hypothetical protein